MSLHRQIRIPPQPPTAIELRALLKEYGMKRWRAAEIMQVAEITFNRYLLPTTSPYRKPIPPIRWERLRDNIAKLDELYTEVA